jgi:hypothetical protein
MNTAHLPELLATLRKYRDEHHRFLVRAGFSDKQALARVKRTDELLNLIQEEAEIGGVPLALRDLVDLVDATDRPGLIAHIVQPAIALQ